MASRSGVTPGSLTRAVTRLEELALRIGVDQERRAAIACLQQRTPSSADAPALHHHVIQLFAQKLVHHAFVLAAHFNEVRQRAHRRHGGTQRSRLEQPPHRVGGVAMIANERVQRVAPPLHGRLFAAQLVGMGAPRTVRRSASFAASRAASAISCLQPLHGLRLPTQSAAATRPLCTPRLSNSMRAWPISPPSRSASRSSAARLSSPCAI